MRRVLALLLAVLCASGTAAAQQTPAADDEAGVRTALEHYLAGHATGDPEEFRKAFHPDARMTFVRDGKLVITPISEYIARAPGKPAADEARRKRSITGIEISGTAATGRIELDYPAVKFVDYMTLLKDNGRWVIIAKSFHAFPRSTPAPVRESSPAKSQAAVSGCYAFFDHAGRPASDSLYWAPAIGRLDNSGVATRLSMVSGRGSNAWSVNELNDTVRIVFSSGFSGTEFFLGIPARGDTLRGRAVEHWDVGPPWQTDAGSATAVRVACPG